MKRMIIISISMMLLASGCASLEQQSILGANGNKEEGFSGFGANRAKYLEGPLTDMMVPDSTPMGRADRAPIIAKEDMYYTSEKNNGFEDQGTHRAGARIVDSRPGIFHEDYLLRDSPHMKRKSISIQQEGNSSLNDNIKNRIMSFEKIDNVFVVHDKNIVLIGVESNEMNRKKLRSELEKSIQDLVEQNPDLDFKITTERRHVNKVRELENGTLMLDTPMER